MTAAEIDNSESELDFDSPLGSYRGVVAYSNLDDHFFSGERHYEAGVYTGYKFQCVEYARRFLMQTKGVVFGQCMRAAEIFAMDKVTCVESGDEHPFVACKNRETTVKPRPGMVLVYPYDDVRMPVGHVAIISEVHDDWVGIAEQNIRSFPWDGKCYGRKVPLKHDKEKGTWHMEEDDIDFFDCSGWMHCDSVPDRAADAKPLKALDKFQSPPVKPEWKRHPTKPVVPAAAVGAAIAAAPNSEDTSEAAKQKAVAEAALHSAQVAAIKSSPVADKPCMATYQPNETAGVEMISAAFRTFQLIIASLKSQVTSFGTGAAGIAAGAKELGIPERLFPAAVSQLGHASENFLSGSVLLVMPRADVRHPRVARISLDSFDRFAEAFSQDMLAKPLGYTNGFRGTTIGHSACRNLKAMMRHKARQWRQKRRSQAGAGATKAALEEGFDRTLYFLDFGAAFPQTFGLDAAATAAYARERLNGLLVAEHLNHHLMSERAKLATGDLKEIDLPPFGAVRVVDFASDAVAICDKTHDLTVDGRVVQASVKLAPWHIIFAACPSVASGKPADASSPLGAKLARLVTAVCGHCAMHPTVLQPLWTHMASQPAALRYLAKFCATPEGASAVFGASQRAPVLGADGAGLVPVLPRGDHFEEVTTHKSIPHPDPEATRHAAALLFLSGGKDGATGLLELAAEPNGFEVSGADLMSKGVMALSTFCLETLRPDDEA